MIDHLLINSTPELHEQTVRFYVATLEPLGYTKRVEIYDGQLVGLGNGTSGTGGANFWIAVQGLGGSEKKQLSNTHFAFLAKDQKTVDECYAKGLEAGGKDNGAPGPRPHYHPGYYGGFLHDPVGNAMEIVNHGQ